MNLKTNIKGRRWQRNDWQGNNPAKSSSHSSAKHSPANSAVALVITLLMLSVITFLAIAFLAMTNRDKKAVTASLDVDTARSMSDAALARAQTEIIAQMMAQEDILSYDYTASHNYITPLTLPSFNITPGTVNTSNVNYDYFGVAGLTTANAASWAQNIGNLFYDPRPPVFVMTNGNLAQPSNDFRFWVDINRNGRFETNGYQPLLDGNGNKVPLTGPPFVTNFNNGEPEWIGVLKYPEYVHSPTNPFIGRYAFMALPIGKTLDLNFIHNYSRYTVGAGGTPTMSSDAFGRDEGVGSWELNMAAFLEALSPAMYQTNTSVPSYSYLIGSVPGRIATGGGAFDDASQILGFRYGYNPTYPLSLSSIFSNSLAFWQSIDEYGTYPSTTFPFDFNEYNPAYANRTQEPWPGTYNSNMFYDVQDLFDPNKTGQINATESSHSSGTNFAGRLANAVSLLDTTNRYTFQRLLDCIGTSSAPEYGVYVYSNFVTTNGLPPPTWLRTKVNINYDNTAQIQAGPYSQTAAGPYGPYTPMPTNLVRWTSLGFFTNAADLLLRSQTFVFTNYATNALGQYIVSSNYFGITNIPVCVTNNQGGVSYLYNEQIHRMLQLAANIYAAANPSNIPGPNGLVPQPPVFRPQLGWINYGTPNAGLYITNYVLAPPAQTALNWINATGFKDITNQNIGPNDYVWGIPWVVASVKGIPEFDQYSYTSRIFYNRELLFIRQTNANGVVQTNKPPASTNQFYVMCISNNFGMDAWNPYISNFYGAGGGLTVFATNFVTITLTNNYNYCNNITFGNYYLNNNGYSGYAYPYWPGRANPASSQTNEFKTFLQTNLVSLPLGYFSEYFKTYYAFSNITAPFTDGFLPQDLGQTGWPVHNWTLNITNHLCYFLADASSGAFYDFVNLGPFGSSTSISNLARGSSYQGRTGSGPPDSVAPWEFNEFPANDSFNSPKSIGITNQIGDAINASGTFPNLFFNSLIGTTPSVGGAYFTTLAAAQTTVLTPYYITDDIHSLMACDPLVHYTIGDLTYPGYTNVDESLFYTYLALPITNSLGAVTPRYSPWPGPVGSAMANNMLFIDPLITSPNAWQFPTNLFPGIGWLGRVHRGTPWQTIYLKSDNPKGPAIEPNPTNDWLTWVNSPYTYPTNDWSLLDLFTAVPNDNAARGLLSVNQTNDAAWAAVFAGVIVITNINITAGTGGGTPLDPTNDVYYLMDTNIGTAYGINVVRALQPNGIFHKIGDILQASTLTVFPPEPPEGPLTDEMVERIPQQTLGLLKLGLPQFVIYSWGQSLKPKNLYSTGTGNLLNICTNYEITGEFLTRTVCHIVSDPGAASPRIVIDNYNIEPGN
jgi:hypothetical protein